MPTTPMATAPPPVPTHHAVATAATGVTPSTTVAHTAMDPFEALPAELAGASGLLEFFGPTELCAAHQVSARWRDFVEAHADPLWRRLCEAAWQGKHGLLTFGDDDVPVLKRVPAFTNLSHPRAAQRLSVRELKDLVNARHVRISPHVLEKEELAIKVRDSTPPFCKARPELACSLPWKAAYASALHDRFRTSITRDELVETEWEFMFRHEAMAFGAGSHDGAIVTSFRADGSFVHPMHAPDGGLSWKLADDGEEVCVHRFPPHKFMRRSDTDWGWRCGNMHVRFESMHRTTMARTAEGALQPVVPFVSEYEYRHLQEQAAPERTEEERGAYFRTRSAHSRHAAAVASSRPAARAVDSRYAGVVAGVDGGAPADAGDGAGHGAAASASASASSVSSNSSSASSDTGSGSGAGASAADEFEDELDATLDSGGATASEPDGATDDSGGGDA